MFLINFQEGLSRSVEIRTVEKERMSEFMLNQVAEAYLQSCKKFNSMGL